MAFREVRDPDTRELVIRYEPETERIEYVSRKGLTRELSLMPYRLDAKKSDQQRRLSS